MQLLSEEYMNLSPNTLEGLGFYTKVLQDPGLSDTQKMFVGEQLCDQTRTNFKHDIANFILFTNINYLFLLLLKYFFINFDFYKYKYFL